MGGLSSSKVAATMAVLLVVASFAFMHASSFDGGSRVASTPHEGKDAASGIENSAACQPHTFSPLSQHTSHHCDECFFDRAFHMGTKSPYNPPVEAEWRKGESDYPTCSPIQVRVLSRHSSRNPGSKDIVAMDRLVSVLRDTFPSLVNPYDVKDASALVRAGEVESFFLGERVRSAFSELLADENGCGTPHFDPSEYTFKATRKGRTSATAGGFAHGLFQGTGPLGRDGYQPIPFEIPDDEELRFFDECDKYMTQVEDSEALEAVYEKCTSASYPTIVDRIHAATGVRLQVPDVTILYKACAFDIALFNVRDRWCELLTDEEILHIEECEDIEDYYEKGPGLDSVAVDMSCPFVKDLHDSVESLISKKTDNKAVFSFAHAETTVPLMFNLADPNMEDFRGVEGWSSSKYSPFGANIGFVIYRCGEPASTTIRIKALFNENVVPLRGCNELMCDWQTFKSSFSREISCPFEEICKV